MKCLRIAPTLSADKVQNTTPPTLTHHTPTLTLRTIRATSPRPRNVSRATRHTHKAASPTRCCFFVPKQKLFVHFKYLKISYLVVKVKKLM